MRSAPVASMPLKVSPITAAQPTSTPALNLKYTFFNIKKIFFLTFYDGKVDETRLAVSR